MSDLLPAWDLTQYCADLDDPKINSDLLEAKNAIENFEKKYRGKVKDLSPKELLEAIKKDEELSLQLGKPSYYLHLSYEAGGENIAKIQQKMISINEQTTNIANLTTFFGVELSKRPDLLNLSKQPELEEYSYYLQRLEENAKHILSEELENVINLKDLTGNEAWSKLFIDLSGKIEVESDLEGSLKKYRESDLTNLLKNTDRSIRQKAWKLLTDELAKNEDLALEAYNNVLLDKKIDDQLRGFTFPQETSLLSNQLSKDVLDSLTSSIKAKLYLFQNYLKLKKEILNLEKFESFDVYADIHFENLELPQYTWNDCKKIVLDAFGEFHPRFREIAQMFFDNNWIDAQNRNQKKSGAFCSSFGPGYHPVVLCTYLGKFEDVLTIAHEVGHGIHSYLTEEKQSLINSNYTLSTAEIASLCCETIVFDKLIANIENPKLKLQLYCNKIEEESGNIFSAGLGYYDFESKVHDSYRENGPLDTQTIRKLWIENRHKNLLGDIVETADGAEFGWSRIHHFMYIFYNYVYSSGLLISSSIYELLTDHPEKVADYLDVLRLGGSKNPVEILKKLDLDIEKPDFWDLGLSLFEKQVKTASDLWLTIKK